jgi:hypothetical protein
MKLFFSAQNNREYWFIMVARFIFIFIKSHTCSLEFKLPLFLSNEFDKNESSIRALQGIFSLKLAPRDIG